MTTTLGTIESRDDKFYRYKREIVTVKIIKRQGIETVVENLTKISRQLKVDEATLRKTISSSLGCMVNNNVFRGEFTAQSIDIIVQKFVEKNVLCPKCSLPELYKDECKACGASFRKQTPSKQQEEVKPPPSKLSEEHEQEIRNRLMYMYANKDTIPISVQDQNGMRSELFDVQTSKKWLKIRDLVDSTIHYKNEILPETITTI